MCVGSETTGPAVGSFGTKGPVSMSHSQPEDLELAGFEPTFRKSLLGALKWMARTVSRIRHALKRREPQLFVSKILSARGTDRCELICMHACMDGWMDACMRVRMWESRVGR